MSTTLAGVALIGAVAVIAVGSCPVPWSAGLLAAGLIASIAAWKSRGDATKLVFANLAAVLAALSAFEGYLRYQEARGDGTTMDGTITGNFTQPNRDLGYAPVPGRRVTARKFYGDEVLYDVVYTIGADGLRVRPRAQAATPAECIVFFGDSVTFGEGVNDDETFAFLVGLKAADRYTVRNFAFSGYGPHQMLAALQAGHVEKVASCRPAHFYYLGILEHIPRVAGLTKWDRHGPRFRLGGHGRPQRAGNFDSTPDRAEETWGLSAARGPLEAYLTWQRFFGRSRNSNDADLDLYVAVVLESARVAQERFPGSTFRMLLWDGRDDPRLETIEKRIAAGGVEVHRLTTVIPEFSTHADRFILSPHDGHPNPEMHLRVAEYIANSLTASPQK